MRGTIFCGQCKQRYIVQRTKGNGGEYFYFLCRGMQDKTCDQPYVPVEVMEDLIIKHHEATAWLPEDVRATIRAGVEQAIANHQGLTDELRQSLEAQLAKGERKESYLIDLAAEEGWPKDVLRDKVRVIREERARIRQQLDQRTGQLEAGRQVFARALDLLDDPARLYAEGNETVRAILNKAFFTRLYVHGRLVTHELREPFDVLEGAYDIYRQRRDSSRPGGGGQPRTYRRLSGSLALAEELDELATPDELPGWLSVGQTGSSAALLMETGAVVDLRLPALAREDASRTLAVVLQGQGWSRDAMVAQAGQRLNPALRRYLRGWRLGDLDDARARLMAKVRAEAATAPPDSGRLSDTQRHAIIERFQAGATGEQLAESYGVSLSTVKRLLRKAGVRKRRPRGTA